LHAVVKFNKAPRYRNEILYIFDNMDTSRRPHGDHGDATELPRLLIGDCLHSDGSFPAFFALPLRLYGAHTALWRRSLR
jgi:hypothetical protein